jgi:ribonuclease T1
MRYILSREVLRRVGSALVCGALLLVPFTGVARESPQSGVAVAALPVEARATLELIRAGGPFSYPRDGVVFSNRERLLPAKPRGYYHEYTVPTPGAKTRGARRVVCGGAVATLSECYYSDDHYQSFRKIQP